MQRPIQPFWRPLAAGTALGLILLLTFLLTGHGLGATGFFTRFTAWTGGVVASGATSHNAYLGPMLGDAHLMDNWITWQVIGVALGALLASLSAGRFRLQLDGAHQVGKPARLLLTFLGGALAGFGARLAAGCTSGMGLSGSATLSVAGFLFLIGFFVSGFTTYLLLQRVRA